MPNKLIINSLYYTLGKMLPMAVSFIMVPIYTRYLLPAEYGILNSMQVLSTIFLIIFTLSIETSLFRLYYDYKDETKRRLFIGSAFILIFVSTTVGTTFLFLFRSTIEKIYTNIPFAPYYILAILIMYFTIFSIVPRIIFVITERGKLYFLTGLLQLLVSLILNIIYIIILDQKAIGALKALLLTNLIMLPVYTYYQFKYSKLMLNLNMAKAILTFSLPLLPASLSTWIINSSNRIFIDRYFSQSEVGVFSLGFRITFVYIVLITSIRLAYNPQYFRLANSPDQSRAKQKLYVYNHYYLVFSIIASFVISFFAKEVVGIFLNDRYYDAWIILALLTYANMFLESSAIYRMSLSQKKATIVIAVIVLCTGVINLILNWIFISRWGMYGAAEATLFSGILLYGTFNLASKKYGYHIQAKYFKLFILLLTGLVINFLFWQIPVSLISSFIIKITLVALCTLFIYWKFGDMIRSLIFEFKK